MDYGLSLNQTIIVKRKKIRFQRFENAKEHRRRGMSALHQGENKSQSPTAQRPPGDRPRQFP